MVPALQAALAAEHAAVYGYGVLGARLRGAQRQNARDVWDAHRAKRDRLSSFIITQKADPVAAAAAYRLPIRPTTTTSAVQLAAALEDHVLAAYLGLAGVADPKVRRFAAQGMQEAINRSVRWLGSAPTSAFPGMSKSAVSPAP
ncbi:ferritin-like domain-containing protein [Actinomadura sp. HBU206391]|nr:ferritin-like domain-containing protein [Actinomadura sp. HBU206391]